MTIWLAAWSFGATSWAGRPGVSKSDWTIRAWAPHKVPALLLQEGTVRVLLEPVSRRVTGADGVVDLYLMPAYDDVASLFYREGNWHVHYVIPGGNGSAVVKDAESGPFSKETLDMLLQEMKKHGK